MEDHGQQRPFYQPRWSQSGCKLTDQEQWPTLVQPCSPGHIKVGHLWLFTILCVENNEGVDLDVGKVQVHIDAVQTDEEINEGILLLRWDVGQEGGRDDVACGERLSYRKVEYERLCVDVAFVGEEDGVAITSRCDANVVFCVGGMGKGGLNDKVVERSGDRFNLKKKISIQYSGYDNVGQGARKADHVI